MINKSRDDWIRTSGLVVPNDARYQAALHPEERIWDELAFEKSRANIGFLLLKLNSIPYQNVQKIKL